MIELYFLLYRIPKMMSRLARERHRSAVAWSLIGMGAWLGAELAVGLMIGLTYGIAALFMDLPEQLPLGLRALTYVLALGAAILSVTLVRRFLTSRPQKEFELPPPPPSFLGING